MSVILSGSVHHFHLPTLAGRLNVRSLRIGVLLAIIAILNGLDLLFTLLAQNTGMLNEMNPLTAPMLQQGLYGGTVCFKVLMVASGLGILWRLRSSRLTLPACWGLLIAYVWLSGVWVRWVEVMSTFEFHRSAGL